MAGFEKLVPLAGVALFAVAGLALVQLLPVLRVLPLGRRLTHAYLLGIAWIAGSLYALSHFFAVPLRRPAVFAVAVLPVLAWLFLLTSRRCRGAACCALGGDKPRPYERLAREPIFRGRGWNGFQIAAVTLAGVVFLSILAEVFTNPLRDWDGRMTWAAQARYMRAEATVDPTVLAEPGWYVTHSWYPALMPVAQVAVLELLRAGDDEHFFRGVYAFFFPAWLLVLYGGARRWTSRSAAALTVLAAALLPMPAIYRGGGAVSAYSDLPLACFYGAGFLLLLKPRPRLSEALAAGLLLGAAVLTKNEGAPLAFWALAVAASTSLLRGGRGRIAQRWRPFATAAAIVLAATVLLLSWRSGIPDRFESYQEIISWSNLWPGMVTRLSLLLPKIRLQMLSLQDWGTFWLAALVVMLAGWRGLRRRITLPLLLAAAAPLGIAWIAYSVSLDPVESVRTSWNRFVLQASVPLFVLLALALDELFREARWLPPFWGGRRARKISPPAPAQSTRTHDRHLRQCPPSPAPPSALWRWPFWRSS
jgi:hypothetical protein